MAFPRKSKIILVLLLVAFGAMSRFLPHIFNFTPVTAIALFASAYFGLRYSIAALVGIMLISDVFIGFYQWEMMAAVYGSFALSAIIGTYIKKISVGSVVVGSLASSLLFFFVTNWAVWKFGTMYEHSFAGLIQSYAMALPFFRNSLVGDILYAGLLFGLLAACNYFVRARWRWKVLSPSVRL